ncbi:MAG: hypothetical protein ACREU7_16575 [Burkholderiales bacterium]
MTRTRAIVTLLTTLHPADRRWLLAQLETPTRKTIGAEVKALLRLPAHARRLSPEVRPRVPVAAPVPDVVSCPEAVLIAQIDAVSGERMAVLWGGAPEWALRAFLQLHAWRHGATLQRLLPAKKLEPCSQPVTPAARHALLQAVWEALQAPGVGSLPPVR